MANKKKKVRRLRRAARKEKRENRTLEAIAAVILALAALGGAYFTIKAGSLYGSLFCFMWIGGTVFWLFSIFGYRRTR